MTFRHSLRSRIIIAFCFFGGVLGSVFALIVYISLDYIDDSLINNSLKQEIDHISRHYQQNNEVAVPASPYIKIYRGTTSMPAALKEMVVRFSEGFHEAYLGKEEFHIAVITLPNLEDPLYLLFKVSALEFTEKRKFRIAMVLVTGVIMVVGLGLWIGWLTSRKVIAPVIYLADQVNKFRPGDLPTDLSKDFINDEVGTLAAALEQSMKRIEAFVEREHQFTRDASHELRTPVTVIKGSVELLRKQLIHAEASVSRPFYRIQRQVTNMEKIIEALLWLSREQISTNLDQPFSVLSPVRDTIEENRQIIADKSIEINLVAEGNPVLNVPEPLFKIALANLIQNAVRYASKGHITVCVRDDRVLVSDTGAGIDGAELENIMQSHGRGTGSKGFGLGLSIVQRLCDRFGWQFEIESKAGRGTTAQMVFASLKK
jgi:signal transduction histidine kinase